MKAMVRTVCAAVAVAALCGCGVPKEEHQKLQDECAAVKSQLARANQDIQSLKSALDQKEADAQNLSQQFQAQKTAYEAVIKKQAGMIEGKSKGSATTGKTTPTAKTTGAKKATPKKSSAH